MKHPGRLYTALPRVGRVRSNSASRALYTNINPSHPAFFDSPAPPPPNTRLATHRLPIEARAEVEGPPNPNSNNGGTSGNPNANGTGHAPLALAAPHSPTTHSPHPAQLALLFPYTPGPACSKPAGQPSTTGGARASRRRGPRYTLDVGAYGIPKRGHAHRVRGLHTHAHTQTTDAPLAVQVGEDAYFVRENAMGVADGVGGWARVKHPAPPSGPSASALFARRLMHFCADEVDRASASSSHHSPPPDLHLHPVHPPHPHPHPHPNPNPYAHPHPHPQASRSRPVVTPWRPPSSSSRFAPYPVSSSLPTTSWGASLFEDGFAFGPSSSASPSAWPSSFASSPAAAAAASPSSVSYQPYAWHADAEYTPASASSQSDAYNEYDGYDEYEYEYDSPADLLAAELDELADGLDVLHILERAYERTLGAHVVAVPAALAAEAVPGRGTAGETILEETPAGKPPDKETAWAFAHPGTHTQPQTKTGTSTSKPQTETETEPKTIPLLAGSSTALVAVLDYVYLPAGAEGAVPVDGAAGASSGSSSTTGTGTEKKNTPTLTPVLKIAHVGDCMGMLVRGGEVAWRSEEMWWRWNTPVQLSAATSSQAAASTAPGGTGKTEEKERAGWWRHFNLSSSSSSASASCPSSSSPAASTPAPPAPAPKAEITPSSAAHLFTLPVKAGDIVILASDGLSDNLWDEDVLEEVGRVGRVFEAGLSSSAGAGGKKGEGEGDEEGVFEMGELDGGGVDGARLRRRTLAGMLSEALCSRARRVATRRAGGRERGVVVVGSPTCSPGSASSTTSPASSCASSLQSVREEREREREGVRVRDEAEWTEEDDTPFARRARETGRVYRGGKNDDISVIVAVIAPAEEHPRLGRGRVEAARAAGSDL